MLINFITFLTEKYCNLENLEYLKHPIAILGNAEIVFDKRKFIFVIQQLFNPQALMGLISQKRVPTDPQSDEGKTLFYMENLLLVELEKWSYNLIIKMEN